MPNRLTWSLALLLPLAACATQPAAPPAPAAAAVQTASPDQAFIRQAAARDAFEMEAARLAVQKARRPAVRAFAQRLLDDHATALRGLTPLAERAGLSLPLGLDPAQQKDLGALQTDSQGFDAAYVAQQRTAHRAAIAQARTEADSGGDPAVRDYARGLLAPLQSHLAQAEKLHGGH